MVKENNPTTSEEEEEQENNLTINRERRIDAHAVIHFTVQTLFEDKPNLIKVNDNGFYNENSNMIKTLCINAVEELVLGELYLSLQEEIRLEMYQKDNSLSCNIHLFLNDNEYNNNICYNEDENKINYYPDCISIQ